MFQLRRVLLYIATVSALGVFGQLPRYRFAPLFTPHALLSDAGARRDFISNMVEWEGRFHCPGVGFDGDTGLTLDGTGIDPETLLPVTALRHNFSAASKEGSHLALLALALRQDPMALSFFAASACGGCGPLDADGAIVLNVSRGACNVTTFVLDVLRRKVDTLDAFDAEYPGICNGR